MPGLRSPFSSIAPYQRIYTSLSSQLHMLVNYVSSQQARHFDHQVPSETESASLHCKVPRPCTQDQCLQASFLTQGAMDEVHVE